METMRSKQGLRTHRMIVACSFTFAAMLLMMLIYSQHFGTKRVILTVNGNEMQIETRQDTVQDMLEELNIPIRAHDRISVDLSHPVRSGDEIELVHTFPVTIVAAGKERIEYTSGENVREVLEEAGLELKPEDEVRPGLDQPVDAGDRIEVVRVTKQIETVEETIAVKTVRVENDRLLAGKEMVVQPGREGILVRTIEKKFENGRLTETKVLSEQVMQESEDRIVAVGTRQPVAVLSSQSPDIDVITKDGLIFGVKKVLDNVTLTAYDAGFKSTGKTSDHPQYGITYTGAKVKEGHTAAVDPDVIPLGWWIYIEGIGLRKAEDIGSAIKGKKIDIYFDSEEEANRFGVKKGYKVYIIGPNKPEMH